MSARITIRPNDQTTAAGTDSRRGSWLVTAEIATTTPAGRTYWRPWKFSREFAAVAVNREGTSTVVPR